MENLSKQSTLRKSKRTTPAEKKLTYAETLELLESVLVLVQDRTRVYYRQNGSDLEIKIENAKIEGDVILPKNES